MKSTYNLYMKRKKLMIVAIIILGNILGSAVSFCQIPIYKKAITYLLYGGDEREKVMLFLAAITIVAVYLISILFLQYFLPSFLVKCKEYMRKEYIQKLVKWPVYSWDSKTSGEFIVNYNNIEDVVSYVFDYAALITSILSIIALMCYIMITIHWGLIVLLIGMLMVLFLVQGISQMLQNKQDEIMEKEEKMVELMDSGVKNIAILKCFQYENDFKKYFDCHVDELYVADKHKNVIVNLIELIQQLAKVVVMLGTPLFCLVLERKKIVQPSAVIVASFSFFIIANSLVSIITNIKNIAEKKQKFEKLDEFFEISEKEKVLDDYEIIKEYSLTLQNVTIQNGDKTLLENCSLQFPKCGVVAIYGESGIGKSSLIKVICGQKKPSSGKITLCDELKQTVSYAPQESMLFQGNLLENLNFAKEKISSEEISKMIEQLKVGERIQELRNGLETQVTSEKELSGGQRQIINLLRAFLKPAKIVLLDEPTSSQSSDMEKKILQGVKEISKEKLCIIVSHSEAVKEIADLTYIVKDKQLIEISGV